MHSFNPFEIHYYHRNALDSRCKRTKKRKGLRDIGAHGLSGAQKARQADKALFDLLLNRKKNR